MKIDDHLLKKLQKLGMIEIEESKIEEVKSQLSEILSFMENLAHVDVSNITLQNQFKTPLREDSIKDSQIQKDVLSHAPLAKDGFFIVPKIIE